MQLFDTHMIITFVAIAIAGGVIGLDRTAVGQFMFSQPVVAAPLTGWVLGDPTAGIIIGAILELIWVLDMPVGTFVPADATISAVSATSIAVLGSTGGVTLPVIGFSILLTVAMAPVTMKAEALVRHWNSRCADAVLTRQGETRCALQRANLSGVVMFFLKSFVLYLVFLPVGVAAVSVFRHLPGTVHHAMAFFVKLLPMLGMALVARRLSMKTIDLFLLSGFIMAVVMGQIFHAPAILIILLTVTGGWLGARYSERRS
jgi:PTS system mannose-specific IIC component